MSPCIYRNAYPDFQVPTLTSNNWSMEVWLHRILSMTLIDLFLLQNQGYSQLEMFLQLT